MLFRSSEYDARPAQYTTPQTKPLSEKITEALNRKPLSDEEIYKLASETANTFNGDVHVLRLARAIEKAHGIK